MASLRRVGRNDPCPCGSGRKYKACCLPRDQAFERARADAQQLDQILVRMIRVPEVFPTVERLWARYWPDDRPPGPIGAAIEATGGGAAADTFDFVRSLLDGAPLEGLPAEVARRAGRDASDPAPTLLDLAVGATAVPDDTAAGRIVDALRQAFSSAFQVLRIVPGRRLWLRDVFTDEVFEVGESAATGQAVPGDVLIACLMPLEGLYALRHAQCVLPAHAVHALRAWGEVELSRLREVRPAAGWRDLWRERPHLLHHYVVRARRQPSLPEVRTTTGEPVEFCRVGWQVRDAPAVIAALDGRTGDLRRDGEEPRWDWLPAPGDPRWAGPGGLPEPERDALLPGEPTLGRVELSADGARLTLVAMSAKRAAAGRALVEDAAGAHVDFRGQERRSPREMLARGGEEERGSPPAPAHGEAIPQALREALDAHMRDYERRWCDTPVPALGGKTPRQAAASADPLLRRRLDDLLLEMESSEARVPDDRDGGASGTMSAERVRQLLGWPPRGLRR